MSRSWLRVVLLTALAVVTTAYPSRAENTRRLLENSGSVTGLAFTPDGKLLASVGENGRLRVCQVSDGREVFGVSAHAGGALAVAVSPDGKTVATGGADGLVVLWDLAKGQAVQRLKGHGAAVAAVAFSPDGKLLASGGYDARICLWTAAGRPVRQFALARGRVTALVFGPDGTWLASGAAGSFSSSVGRYGFGMNMGDQVRIWQVGTGKELRVLSIRGWTLGLAASGKLLAAGGHVPDVQQDEDGIGYDGHSQTNLADPTTGQARRPIKWRGQTVALSADGKLLATGAGTTRHFKGGGWLGPNGLNARMTDLRVRVWEAGTGKELMRLPVEDAEVLAFAPDGKSLAVGRDNGDLLLWDLEKERVKPTLDPREIVKRPEGDALLSGLHDDYQELVQREKDPRPLREAAKILNRTSGWYAQDAFALLRRHRSPAGVPLLLRYLVEHAAKDNFDPSSYYSTFAVLTGVEITGAGRSIREAVEQLVKTWWELRKRQPVTDPARMSREQLHVVVGRLLPLAEAGVDRDNSLVRVVARQLREVLGTPSPDQRAWWDEEAHPALGPVLLERAGYQEKPDGAPDRQRIVYGAVPLLATLHRRGATPLLAKIVQDEKQSSAVRLVCLLARYRGGEALDTKALLGLLASEKRLDRRVTLVLALKHAQPKEAGAKLVELLDDDNVHVRMAALRALSGPKPLGALPKLAVLLDTTRSTDAWKVLDLIGVIGTREGQTILARYLQAVLNGDAPGDNLLATLDAFEAATGRQFAQPGAQSDDHYRDAARNALAWWRKQNPVP